MHVLILRVLVLLLVAVSAQAADNCVGGGADCTAPDGSRGVAYDINFTYALTPPNNADTGRGLLWGGYRWFYVEKVDGITHDMKDDNWFTSTDATAQLTLWLAQNSDPGTDVNDDSASATAFERDGAAPLMIAESDFLPPSLIPNTLANTTYAWNFQGSERVISSAATYTLGSANRHIISTWFCQRAAGEIEYLWEIGSDYIRIDANGQLRFFINGTPKVSSALPIASGCNDLTDWNFLAITASTSADPGMEFWLNGTRIAQTLVVAAPWNGGTPAQLTIGGRAGSAADTLNGLIYELGVADNTAMTNDEFDSVPLCGWEGRFTPSIRQGFLAAIGMTVTEPNDAGGTFPCGDAK